MSLIFLRDTVTDNNYCCREFLLQSLGLNTIKEDKKLNLEYVQHTKHFISGSCLIVLCWYFGIINMQMISVQLQDFALQTKIFIKLL